MIEGAESIAAGLAAPDDVCAGRTPHDFLRLVTRPWHDGVETAFAQLDLRTFDGLAGFLQRQALALFPLERALERSGLTQQLADWPARRRGPALADDLSRLGLAVPHGPDLNDFASDFQALGALYVLEGSKLGGRVLHRRSTESPDPRVRAAQGFLGHRHERGWPSFLALLNATPTHAAARAGLRDGARIAFTLFQAAARTDALARFADAPTRSGLYHQAHA